MGMGFIRAAGVGVLTTDCNVKTCMDPAHQQHIEAFADTDLPPSGSAVRVPSGMREVAE